MDYAMPRADDLPSFQLSHTTTLCPGNPLGVKGCGEAGAIGASAAVINAITNAIGNNRLEMPATADRVWHAIHGNASEGAAPCPQQLIIAPPPPTTPRRQSQNARRQNISPDRT